MPWIGCLFLPACIIPAFGQLAPRYAITTVAGIAVNEEGARATNAWLERVAGIAVDGAGNLYVSENLANRVRRISPAGTITTVAGTGSTGRRGDGGQGVEAELNFPNGLAADRSGNLYIADSDNHVVRRLGTDGILTTIAGTGRAGYSGDGGPATGAMFSFPFALAFDGAGNLYVADTGNHTVRRISQGLITTVAGTGTFGVGPDGPAGSSALATPQAIAADAGGAVFIAEIDGNRVRRVAGGAIATVAGTGQFGSTGDAGLARQATLAAPSGIAVTADGTLFIAERNRVRRVANGTISTIAGLGGFGFLGENEPAIPSRLAFAEHLALDASGTRLYIVDAANNRIRIIDAGGRISTVSGSAPNPVQNVPANTARIHTSAGIAADARGNLYFAERFANRVRRISPEGTITTFAGTGEPGFEGDGGPATAARLTLPWGVAADSAGNVYVADSGNARVRRIGIDGIIRTYAGTGVFGFEGDGVAATAATLASPTGLAVDAQDNLFIADRLNFGVRRVDARTGIITDLRGNCANRRHP